MIINELQYHELLGFLQPILRLESYGKISDANKAILKMPMGTTVGTGTSAVPEDERVLLKYKDYRLDILHVRWFDDRGIAIHLHFKTKKKWWHGFLKDQTAELVGDLKRICTEEINHLTFEKYEHISSADIFGNSAEKVKCVYFHDAQAFNKEWQQAWDMSPIIISQDTHDGKCFVEFCFWGGGYIRHDDTTFLRSDWLQYAGDVATDIEQEAKRRLGF